MALTKGVNSYVTVAEADLYFADRLDASAWTSADATSKAQALVTATNVLDDMSWTGTAISESQPLAFPRNGNYFDPRLGSYIYMDGIEVPARILYAVSEMAQHLLNNDGMLDDTGSVDTIAVGPITLNNIKKPSLIPAVAKKMITPLLAGAGSRGWWRSN